MNQRGYGVAQDTNYPDHSQYLWHLTSDRPPLSSEKFGDDERNSSPIGDGQNRLISILSQSPNPTIWQSHLHYITPKYHDLEGKIRCVCFTECVPESLNVHAERFSKWGLLFKKDTLYIKGVRPVWYLDADLFNCFSRAIPAYQRKEKPMLEFPPQLLHLLMPFAPEYGEYRFGGRNGIITLDYTVEREWRVGNDLQFDFEEIAAIIAPNEAGMLALVNQIDRLEDTNFVLADSLPHNGLQHYDFDHYFRKPN